MLTIDHSWRQLHLHLPSSDNLTNFSKNSTSGLLFRRDVLWTYWIIAFFWSEQNSLLSLKLTPCKPCSLVLEIVIIFFRGVQVQAFFWARALINLFDTTGLFYTPLKHHKTFDVQMISGERQKDQWRLGEELNNKSFRDKSSIWMVSSYRYINRISCPDFFCKIAVPRNFTKFSGNRPVIKRY